MERLILSALNNSFDPSRLVMVNSTVLKNELTRIRRRGATNFRESRISDSCEFVHLCKFARLQITLLYKNANGGARAKFSRTSAHTYPQFPNFTFSKFTLNYETLSQDFFQILRQKFDRIFKRMLRIRLKIVADLQPKFGKKM